MENNQMIPEDASVSASGDLLVPLSHRESIYEFAFDDLDEAGGYDYFDVEYILINKKNQYHGAGSYAYPQKNHFQRIKHMIDDKIFNIVYEEEDFLLLKRPGI